MKKLLMKALLLGVMGMTVRADQSLDGSLEEAVLGTHTIRVNQLLRRLDMDTMALAQKKILISDLVELAEGVLKKKKAQVRLLGSTKDFAMGTLGSLVGSIGLLYFGHSCFSLYKHYNNGMSWRSMFLTKEDAFFYHGGASFVPAFLGAYVAYKGLTCSTQREEIEHSRAIRNSMEEKKEELGL